MNFKPSIRQIAKTSEDYVCIKNYRFSNFVRLDCREYTPLANTILFTYGDLITVHFDFGYKCGILFKHKSIGSYLYQGNLIKAGLDHHFKQVRMEKSSTIGVWIAQNDFIRESISIQKGSILQIVKDTGGSFLKAATDQIESFDIFYSDLVDNFRRFV